MVEFKNTNQLRSFMKKESRRLNININNIYSTYISRLFLERLSKYNNENMVLVKGSAAELAYLKRPVRSIVDIDLATLNNFSLNSSWFQNILNDSFDNQFTFSLLERDNSKNVKYVSQTKTGINKLTLLANFDKTSQPLKLDIQENYNRLIEPVKILMPKLFTGDMDFEILAPSYEEYLAEKLCIILGNNKIDVPNTRVKDFYDVYQLHGGTYDSDKLTIYFALMLKKLAKVNIHEAKTIHLNASYIAKHKDLWEYVKRKYDFLDQEIDLAGAVYYTRAVLREQLQKNGEKMEDNITPQYKKIK